MATIKVALNLVNLIQGVDLKLFVADVSKGDWTIKPPQTLRPNESASCECWGSADGCEVTLVYEPDQFRQLTVKCRPNGTALNATWFASPGYEVGLGPGGVRPDYVLGLNYRRA